MPNFLSSFADKAQSALNASPLAAHLPQHRPSRPNSPDPAPQPAANDAAAQGSRSHTFETISHQFRSLQQQYTTTTPIQKIITAEKGLAIDFDSVSRDAKAQSKELYTWGQTEGDDLKDVTDRLAYLNFVQGSLAASLSDKLDNARNSFKALRDAETALGPRRNARAALQSQIARVEHEQVKGNEKRIADMRDQLRKVESDDQSQEREVQILKRKAVRESEQLKWDAIREYGEKLVLLAQAATPIIAVLPAIPPTPNLPYQGAQTTGAVRASLQRALDNYKTGHINLPSHPPGAQLTRSDTLSFGETHATELSNIQPNHSILPDTPHNVAKPLPPASPQQAEFSHKQSSPPINPEQLNQSPTVLPAPAVHPPSTVPVIIPNTASPASPPSSFPAITPTVAETGLPVSAGPAGPGPASGSLYDVKSASSHAGPHSAGFPEGQSQAPVYGQPPASEPFVGGLRPLSSLEEKQRLAALYSQQDAAATSRPSILGGSFPASTPAAVTSPTLQSESQAKPESAEEEKKRLEREERERILHAPTTPAPNDKEEDLPPYQELK